MSIHATVARLFGPGLVCCSVAPLPKLRCCLCLLPLACLTHPFHALFFDPRHQSMMPAPTHSITLHMSTIHPCTSLTHRQHVLPSILCTNHLHFQYYQWLVFYIWCVGNNMQEQQLLQRWSRQEAADAAVQCPRYVMLDWAKRRIIWERRVKVL